MTAEELAALAEPHRPELRVHCHRLLDSFAEAEDLVQETLLHARRGRHAYEGRASAASIPSLTNL